MGIANCPPVRAGSVGRCSGVGGLVGLAGDLGRHYECGGCSVFCFGGVDHWFCGCAVVAQCGGVVFAGELGELG